MQGFKTFLSEAKVKAEDYEAAIVIGWYELHERELDSKSGITDKTLKVLESNPEVLASGKRIAEYVLKTNSSLAGAQAEQYGRASTKLTKFWTSHGATNKTPKTDILIGTMRFSLKIGAAQLMSGGKSESSATFYAAVKNTSKKLSKNPQFKVVEGILESFVTNTLAPSQLRGIIKSGENEVVNAGEAAHKQCMTELGLLFEQSKEFKVAFAREAMSGFEKFGESDAAAAEYMLVSSHDGNSVKIKSVYDDDYCSYIADKMKLQARFKTSGRVLNKKKTGEYNFWSVISLIVNAMDEDIDAYNNGEILTEIRLFKNLTAKVKGFFNKVWKKATKFFKKGTMSMMKFLGVEPTVTHSKDVNFD
jgi:hypothetical protein